MNKDEFDENMKGSYDGGFFIGYKQGFLAGYNAAMKEIREVEKFKIELDEELRWKAYED